MKGLSSEKKNRVISIGLGKAAAIILTLSMLVTSVMMPILASDSASSDTEFEAEIMKVKGGADSIATLTFDDGVHASSAKLEPLLLERNLCASLMVVPSRIQGIAPYTSGYSTVLQLNEFLENGALEVQSHSYSHIYIVPEGHVSYTPENNTDENRERETVGSKDWLAAHFPNTDQIVFATPGGSYDDATMKLVKDTFYACRDGQKATLASPQTLDISENAEIDNWYNIRSMWLTEASIVTIEKYLDACVENGNWFFEKPESFERNTESSRESATFTFSMSCLLYVCFL